MLGIISLFSLMSNLTRPKNALKHLKKKWLARLIRVAAELVRVCEVIMRGHRFRHCLRAGPVQSRQGQNFGNVLVLS